MQGICNEIIGRLNELFSEKNYFADYIVNISKLLKK